jgi:hypothetical protein
METRLFHSIVTVGLSLTAAGCGSARSIPSGADAAYADGTVGETGTDGAPEAATGDAESHDSASQGDAAEAGSCACGMSCCPNEAGVQVLCPCDGGVCFPCYV